MMNKNISKRKYHGMKDEDIYSAYKIFFGTLFSESRLKIINLLREKERSVSEIILDLKMDQSAISHDLARLRNCGFVKTERKGKFVYYNLNEETIKPLMEIIDTHMSKFCIHILHNMKGEHRGR